LFKIGIIIIIKKDGSKGMLKWANSNNPHNNILMNDLGLAKYLLNYVENMNFGGYSVV